MCAILLPSVVVAGFLKAIFRGRSRRGFVLFPFALLSYNLCFVVDRQLRPFLYLLLPALAAAAAADAAADCPPPEVTGPT